VAFVVSVLEAGQPVADETKLGRLRQILLDIMDVEGDSVAHIKRVRACDSGLFWGFVDLCHYRCRPNQTQGQGQT
jgi:hypothetical protein